MFQKFEISYRIRSFSKEVLKTFNFFKKVDVLVIYIATLSINQKVLNIQVS